MKFSANLGFLWTELSLLDAVRAAKMSGFDAVECHWPYDTSAADLKRVLEETGLPILGLNTVRGNVADGDMGLAALPGRDREARRAIDQALAYAAQVGAGNVHVMGGNADGQAAHEAYLSNLRYACDRAGQLGLTILIEPLNAHDAPGYFLSDTDQARQIIDKVSKPNLKMMFDCYHVGRTEGDVVARFEALLPYIGHVQFAAVPDRGPPDHGDVDYAYVFAAIQASGWDTPLGAEYRPGGPTEASLGWLTSLKGD